VPRPTLSTLVPGPLLYRWRGGFRCPRFGAWLRRWRHRLRGLVCTAGLRRVAFLWLRTHFIISIRVISVAPIYPTVSALYAAQQSFSTKKTWLSGHVLFWFLRNLKPAPQLAKRRFYGMAQSESATCPLLSTQTSPFGARLRAGRHRCSAPYGPLRSRNKTMALTIRG